MTSLLPLMLALHTGLPSDSARPLRRFLLASASNDGGPGKVRLRFSGDDARGVASVMGSLGGVSLSNSTLLFDPDTGRFLSTMDDLSRRMALSRDSGNRVELMFYYSGHSDEDGLLLGGSRLPYSRLRKALDASPAEIRLAVLDACASGAALRAKGGLRRQPFKVEGSDRLRGQAYLTSSRAEESSQESDQLRGSFFTQAFLAGLRGAADTDGDGKVTLIEAYRYAYKQTVENTSTTRSGPQHPEFDLDLSGSGDVVLTDISQAGAALELPSGLSGRVEVFDSTGVAAIDLQKFPGRDLSLGLTPGSWRIVVTDTSSRRVRRVVLLPAAKTLYDLAGPDSLLPAVATSTGAHSIFSASDSLRASRGGSLDTIPVNFGLLPPLSLNGDRGPHVLNKFSMDLFMGEAAEISGVQMGGGYMLASRSTAGLQVSTGLARTGKLRGAQLGSAVVADDTVWGAQLGDICSISRKGGLGAQLSGVAGWSDGDWKGVQLGTVALASGKVTGVQAGVLGYAGGTKGFQVAVVTISGGHVSGAQAGVVNIARSLDGAQLGVVNIAGTMRGTQIGVVNLADSADGLVMGLVNLARDMEAMPVGVVSAGLNMTPSVETRAEESGWASVGVRLDGRRFHVRLALLSDLGQVQDRIGCETGFGAHWGLSDHLRLELDATNRNVFSLKPGADGNGAQWNTIGAGLRWKLGPVGIAGGATWNVLVPHDEGTAADYVNLPRDYQWDASRHVRMWPGAWAGISI